MTCNVSIALDTMENVSGRRRGNNTQFYVTALMGRISLSRTCCGGHPPHSRHAFQAYAPGYRRDSPLCRESQ
jgi:hypothetical protein